MGSGARNDEEVDQAREGKSRAEEALAQVEKEKETAEEAVVQLKAALIKAEEALAQQRRDNVQLQTDKEKADAAVAQLTVEKQKLEEEKSKLETERRDAMSFARGSVDTLKEYRDKKKQEDAKSADVKSRLRTKIMECNDLRKKVFDLELTVANQNEQIERLQNTLGLRESAGTPTTEAVEGRADPSEDLPDQFPDENKTTGSNHPDDPLEEESSAKN